MSNSIYNSMNSNDMVRKFQQFKANFTGNPQAEVQRLLNTGKMTQAQFNQLQGMARNFQGLLK